MMAARCAKASHWHETEGMLVFSYKDYLFTVGVRGALEQRIFLLCALQRGVAWLQIPVFLPIQPRSSHPFTFANPNVIFIQQHCIMSI